MKIKVLLYTAWIMLVILHSSEGFAQDEEKKIINLIMLLSSPDSFDSTLIGVDGWICWLGRDGVGLFLTKDDCKNENTNNAIELLLNNYQIASLPKLSKIVVYVEGRFTSRQNKVALDSSFPWGRLKVDRILTDYPY